MRTNVQIESLETFVQVLMIVEWQSAWMRVERERAQRAAQAGQLDIELFGMAALRKTKVP